ncbi:MAG TPA: hypothetical protein PL110_01890 [Candidatus Eremiobacteraeota bacterium]|nr:hypothetical protein [Candidatus Eremiobacteraeota bacterium]
MTQKYLTFISILLFALTFSSCERRSSGTAEKTPASSTTTNVSTGQGVEVGNTATNFILNDMSGKTVDLSSLKGKKLVHIVFWSSG